METQLAQLILQDWFPKKSLMTVCNKRANSIRVSLLRMCWTIVIRLRCSSRSKDFKKGNSLSERIWLVEQQLRKRSFLRKPSKTKRIPEIMSNRLLTPPNLKINSPQCLSKPKRRLKRKFPKPTTNSRNLLFSIVSPSLQRLYNPKIWTFQPKNPKWWPNQAIHI